MTAAVAASTATDSDPVGWVSSHEVPAAVEVPTRVPPRVYQRRAVTVPAVVRVHWEDPAHTVTEVVPSRRTHRSPPGPYTNPVVTGVEPTVVVTVARRPVRAHP